MNLHTPWCLLLHICNYNGPIHVCELAIIYLYAYNRLYMQTDGIIQYRLKNYTTTLHNWRLVVHFAHKSDDLPNWSSQMPPKSAKCTIRIIYLTQRHSLTVTIILEQLLSLLSVSITRKTRWRAVTITRCCPLLSLYQFLNMPFVK